MRKLVVDVGAALAIVFGIGGMVGSGVHDNRGIGGAILIVGGLMTLAITSLNTQKKSKPED